MMCSNIMVLIAAVLFGTSAIIDVTSFIFRRNCWINSASRQSLIIHRYRYDRLIKLSPVVVTPTHSTDSDWALALLRYDNTDKLSAQDTAVDDDSYSSLYVLPNSPVSLSSTVGFIQHWGREQADTGSAITVEV